ncbi:MAG: hypothetical protein AB7O67_19205 [Vicinamibacterales bacterium]
MRRLVLAGREAAEAASDASPFVILLTIGVAAVYGATLLTLTTARGAAVSLLSQAIFAAPGVLIMRRALGARAGWLLPLTLGPLLGVALSSITLLLLWAAGGREAWTLPAAALLAATPALAAHRVQGRWRPAVAARGDVVTLAVLLLVVPLVVAWPFAHVGMDVGDGLAYRAYFTADYVWRRAVVAELAKGIFLPPNPFYVGDTMHYYWLPHLITAVEYRTVGRALGLDALLLTRSVLMDAVFVGFLYGVARLVARPLAAAAGIAAAILFTSFEGLYALWEHWRLGVPMSLVRYLNIDALVRWEWGAMPIDGLHRVLLYQPHHATGYAMGLLGLLVVARRARAVDVPAFAVAGTLLGVSTLISSFGGLMFTAAAAVYEGVGVLRARAWWRATVHLSAAALPLALAAAGVTALDYVDHGGAVLSFGLNPVSIVRPLAATALSFGPMLLLGGAGALAAWRARESALLPFLTLIGVSIGFYFFVDIRDHQDVYVGWRVGHLSFMALGVLVAYGADRAGRLRLRPRVAVFGAAALVALASAPTVAIDIVNTQDVWNREMAAGFHWTQVLTPDDQAAFAWIQARTPTDSVFQLDPVARGTDGWAYLPAFAERRMGVGLPISMVPLQKYEEGSRRARWMFEHTDVTEVVKVASRNDIDYFFIGPPEREAHPDVEARFDQARGLLPLVYRNGSISIYEVPKTDGPQRH